MNDPNDVAVNRLGVAIHTDAGWLVNNGGITLVTSATNARPRA